MVNLYKRGECWYYDIYLASTGKRYRKSLGKCSREEAKEKLKGIASEYESLDEDYTLDKLISLFQNVETNPRYLSAKMTLKKYGEERARTVANQSKFIRFALLKNYPKLLKKKIRDFDNIDAKHVRASIFKEYGSTCKSKELFKIFKTFFSQALDEGWIRIDPCKGLENIDYKKKTRDVVDIEVIKKVMRLSFDDPLLKEKLNFFSIVATTGMRRSEVLALSKDQIYKNTLTLNKSLKTHRKDSIGLPKADIVRVFPLSNVTSQIISSMKPNEKGRYFYHSRSWCARAYNTVIEKALEIYPDDADEILKIKPHVLRHTLTTCLIASGNVPESFVSEYFGWEHQHMLVMERNYTHLKSQHLQTVADQIDIFFG